MSVEIPVLRICVWELIDKLKLEESNEKQESEEEKQTIRSNEQANDKPKQEIMKRGRGGSKYQQIESFGQFHENLQVEKRNFDETDQRNDRTNNSRENSQFPQATHSPRQGSQSPQTHRSNSNEFQSNSKQSSEFAEFSHVVELYNFPSNISSDDIEDELADMKRHGFKLKWINDDSCLLVLSSQQRGHSCMCGCALYEVV
jgi:hypothetical protein